MVMVLAFERWNWKEKAVSSPETTRFSSKSPHFLLILSDWVIHCWQHICRSPLNGSSYLRSQVWHKPHRSYPHPHRSGQLWHVATSNSDHSICLFHVATLNSDHSICLFRVGVRWWYSHLCCSGWYSRSGEVEVTRQTSAWPYHQHHQRFLVHTRELRVDGPCNLFFDFKGSLGYPQRTFWDYGNSWTAICSTRLFISGSILRMPTCL